jgi:hypothetical protein
MTQLDWIDQVGIIHTTLTQLEVQVAEGSANAPALEDLKSALDELRLRAWGLLMATGAEDYQGFQERFRLRRTREMCSAITNDLKAGRLSLSNPELPPFGQATRESATTIPELAMG